MTETINSVSARVEAVVCATIETDQRAFTPETDLVSAFHIDSLDALRLALQLETEFGINFEQSDVGSFRTVNDIVQAVETRMAQVTAQ